MFNDLIGVPFKDGGRGLDGLDCWGLTIEVFKRYGIEIPDFKIAAEDASRIDQEINANREFWQPCGPGEIPVPSLVVIKFHCGPFCNHTGVYIGEGRFIHTRQKIGVNIDRIHNPAWQRIIEGFYIPRAR